MSNDKSITKSAPAALATTASDARLNEAVAESLVIHGDVSKLTQAQRTALYLAACREHGLNPRALPFSFLRLNGKEIMYANKGCGDQLARLHNVTREIIDGPKVIDLAGTKLVYCVAKASLPNGRFETATATVPLIDPVNVLMKCETKGKRRATLALLGLALLDESEVADIPASAKGAVYTPTLAEIEAEPIVTAPPLTPRGPTAADVARLGIEHPQRAPRPDVTHAIDPRTGAVVQGDDTERLTPADDPERAAIEAEAQHQERPEALVAFEERVADVELPGEGVVVWMKHRDAIKGLTKPQQEAAWAMLVKRCEVVGKMKNAKVWLSKAVKEETERRAAEVNA